MQEVGSTNLLIQENPQYGTYVEGLRVINIETIDDLNTLFGTMKSVKDYRYFANSHHYSCKSHQIVRLDVKSRDLGKRPTISSKLGIFNFFELAGNEISAA
jgi:hypothetical protein